MISKFVARFASYIAFIILLTLSGNVVASRHLHYDDAKLLVSDGVSEGSASTRVEESFLHLKGKDSDEEQCNNLYGTLPCLSNPSRQICLLMMYEILLFRAESWAGGDGRLFRAFGKNNWFLIFYQLLDALPNSLILFAMGLSTSDEKAQEYIVTGVGMLAGSSILLLTLLWGLCFCCGRKKFYVKPLARKKSKVLQLLTGSGILIDVDTKLQAKFLFCSLIPFVTILLPGSSYSSQEYKSILVSVSCILFYFIYQCCDPRIWNKRLEYAEAERIVDLNIPFYEVEALMLDRERYFQIGERDMERRLLMENPEKSNDKLTMKEFYDEFKIWIKSLRQLLEDPSSFDKSGVKYNQVMELIHENKKYFIDQISRLFRDVTGAELEYGEHGAPNVMIIHRFFQLIDTNGNGYITPDELKNFFMELNQKELVADDGIAEIMMTFLGTDNKGGITKYHFLNGVSKLFESQHLTNQPQGLWVEAKIKFLAIIWLLVGTGMIFGLAKPLVESVRELSESLGMGPYNLNFILLPLATNFRTILAAIKVAAMQKKHQTISIIFSEIYHKVFMNNVVGFFVIVEVIYFRGLTWHFSAELLIVIMVCIIMGFLASFKTKFPNWTLLIVVPLYPLSLLAVYLVNDAFRFP